MIPTTTPDLAALAQQLEQVLKPGYSLARTHGRRWYLKHWDSWIGPEGPRMGWRDVDSDRELGKLLQRLEEGKG